MTPRRLREEVKSNNLKAMIAFVDFKNFFNSVHPRKMHQILKAYGILEMLVNTIRLIHEEI